MFFDMDPKGFLAALALVLVVAGLLVVFGWVFMQIVGPYMEPLTP